MERLLANHPAMQINPIVHHFIDSEGRRCIQRNFGEPSYDFRPQHLATFDVFDVRDFPDDWLEEQLNRTFGNDSSECPTSGLEQPTTDAPGQGQVVSDDFNFNFPDVFTKSFEQPTTDAPGQIAAEDFNSYPDLYQSFDFLPSDASQDDLLPAPQALTVPVPRGSVSMMGFPQNAQQFGSRTFTSPGSMSYAMGEQQQYRHGIPTARPQSMPYVFPPAHQYTRPVLANTPPMVLHRQPAPQSFIRPVLAGPGALASNSRPVPQLFTAPYRQLASRRLKGGFPQLTASKFFTNIPLPTEVEVQIFKYVLKSNHPFRVTYNGKINSHSAEMQNLLFVSHATRKKYPGLLYRQNIFLCEHAKSITQLLRQPIEVTTQILHIDLAVGVISQMRFDELRKLRGLRTIRIIGATGYNTGFKPTIPNNATTAQRLQRIQLAVQTTLNSPAVRARKGTARFIASQRAVRDLMKKRNVKVTFAAQYSVFTYATPKWTQYETVFEIKLVGGERGYALQLKN